MLRIAVGDSNRWDVVRMSKLRETDKTRAFQEIKNAMQASGGREEMHQQIAYIREMASNVARTKVEQRMII